MPSIKNSGENARMVVMMVVNTGMKTSLAPSTAASTGDLPIARWRLMFSDITMASSTMIPMTMAIAAKVIESSVTSKTGNRNKAPNSATGKPMATQNADRLLRNTTNTRPTSTRPIKPLDCTTSMRFFTNLEVSPVRTNVMCSPSSACCSSTNVRTALTVRIMSADSFLSTRNEMALCPFIRDRISGFSKSSLICATSRTRTLGPSNPVRTMTSPINPGSSNSASATIFLASV